jgi:moderate conductance mechanosensitive channel
MLFTTYNLPFAMFFSTPPHWESVVLALLAAGITALAAAVLAGRLLNAVVRHSIARDGIAPGHPAIRTPIRLARVTLFLVLLVALTPPALELFGQRPRRGLHIGELSEWALAGGLRLVLVAAIAFVLVRLLQVLVRRFEQEVSTGADLDVLERAKRAKTLGGLVRNVLTTLIVVVASLMILREVGLDITPILTGAGILGLAVGFGAQTLVKDVISGFFLILENEVRVGDIVSVGTHAGVVEEMTLRTMVLRDLHGTVHIIPNGSIDVLSNRSKDFSFAVLDVPAAYSADTDQVVAIIKHVGASLRADATFAPFLLEDIEVLGVDAFGDSSVTIKARMKTMPTRQWEIAREFRRRLKKEYAARGFEFPFPTRTLHVVGRDAGDQ